MKKIILLIKKIRLQFQEPKKLTKLLWGIFILLFVVSVSMGIYLGLKRRPEESMSLIKLMVLSVFIPFAGIPFTGIWLKTTVQNNRILKDAEKDYGLAWLAGAMLCWASLALYELMGMSGLNTYDWYYPCLPFFSSLNSICFLYSLLFFEYRRELLNDKVVSMVTNSLGIRKDNIKKKILIYIALAGLFLIFISSVFPEGLPLRINHYSLKWWHSANFYKANASEIEAGSRKLAETMAMKVNISAFFDAVLLGIPVIYLLWIVLRETWKKRKYGEMKYMTFSILFLVLFMQIANATNFGDNYPLADLILKILYKVLLITIFFAIAFSWTLMRLKEQQVKLDKKTDELEQDRKAMNHGIRASLHVLQLRIKGYIEEYKEFEYSIDPIELVETIQQRIEGLYQLHDFLHSNYEIIAKGISTNKFFIKFCDYIRKSYFTENPTDFKPDIRIPEDIKITPVEAKSYITIIDSLVHNAIKYSPADRLKVVVRMYVTQEAADRCLVIEVEDDGYGFPDVPDKKFGLGIVYELVAHHKGKIKNSPKREGSIVTVEHLELSLKSYI